MTVVTQILDRMSGVAKPQRKFFLTLMASMLIIRGRINFLSLSRHSQLSEKTYRRQFQKAFDFLSFNRETIEQAQPAQQPPLFAQDTSFSQKSGKQTYGLDYFFNGTASRAERGLEVSLISLVDVARNQALALSAEQTPAQPKTPKAQMTETRIDFYLSHLERTAPHFPAAVKYGVVDGFYAKQKFVSGVCHLGYHLISKLRTDARLLYLYEGAQKKRGRPRKYAGRVKLERLHGFERVSTTDDFITLYSKVVWSVSLKRAVRLVVVVNRKENKKPRRALLFSTDTELAAATIYQYYKARFQIEFLFRDAKQFAGFSDCQARDQKALHFHFNASVATVNIARIIARQEQSAEENFIFSMSSLKQRFFNEHLLNLIITKLALDQTAVKNHPQFEYLRSYGAIAA